MKYQTFTRRVWWGVLLLALTTLNGAAQNATPPAAGTAKAEQIIQSALVAVGGPAYLNVKTVTGRGQYTPFRDGTSTLPSSFVDFISWPDRERTEFKSSQNKLIQVNTGDAGWIYDGNLKTFKDMGPEQVDDFKLYVRTTVDNLLRGFWRKERAELSYVGRREAGLAKRNEVVKLTYPDGFEVEYEIGAKDFLPAKSVYRKKDGEGVMGREEDRFAQYINVGGVNAPFVIDHFREDVQVSRVNYQTLEYNRSLPEELFVKPANPKAVKWN